MSTVPVNSGKLSRKVTLEDLVLYSLSLLRLDSWQLTCLLLYKFLKMDQNLSMANCRSKFMSSLYKYCLLQDI